MRWLAGLLLLTWLVSAQEERPAPEGRGVYLQEACWQCHFQEDDPRFPRIIGTRMTGPVLDRPLLPRSREWHLAHLLFPRSLVADSQMPAYPQHFDPHGKEREVDAFVRRYDTADGSMRQDGIVTRAEYEAAGGTAWRDELARLDSGNEVVSAADAAPVPTAEFAALVDYLGKVAAAPAPVYSPMPPPPGGDRAEAVARGAELFARHCAGCHGERADGNGKAAPFFGDHPPRNLLRGEYKFRSTLSPEPPTDDDLFLTIRRGAGPSMPAWPLLADRQVWDLVEFVKSNHPLYLPRELFVARPDGGVAHAFTRDTEEADASGVALGDGRIVKRAGAWWWAQGGRETRITGAVELAGHRVRLGKPVFDWLADFEPKPLAVPDPPFPYTRESADIGAKVYKEFGCFACHGPTGKGDGPATRKFRGSLGQILRPADYSRGALHLKGGADARSLVRAFMTGLQGTPMPAFKDNFGGTKAAPARDAPWHLAHFVMQQAGIPFE